jgi:starch-binding outer membrane protein SusE/F
MKFINHIIFLLAACFVLHSCKKDMQQVTMSSGTAPVVTLSPATLVLTNANAADSVLTVSWTRADFGFKAAINYTVEIAKAGSNFTNPKAVNVGTANSLKYLGAVVNELAIGEGIAAGSTGILEVRVKAVLSNDVYLYAAKADLTVTTYAVEFPALLVKGGNSWVTPSVRTKGYVLASPNYDGKYEGYLNLPNADGWGGDAFQLVDASSGTIYGWGSSSTTMAVGGGNLWLTPTPNYMKVNADINALTINYTPVQFFVSGDHNGWSTAATPMLYNPATKQLVAENVFFTAGNKLVFTSNGGYDLSYKVNNEGKLIYAGPPNWAGNNIDAPGTGTYKVILDLSAGDGAYTFKFE